MKIIDFLEKLENTARGSARLNVLKESNNDVKYILTMVMTPHVTFGIKELPDANNSNGVFFVSDNDWFVSLRYLLDKLSSRSITGGAAEEAVAEFLGKCSCLQLKWSSRIIKRDLRLDIGAKDVNKSLKDLIKLWEVPLATDINEVNFKYLKGEWCIQAKLDGIRCVCVLPSNMGEVQLMSRTGKLLNNFGSIKSVMQEYNNTRSNADDTIYLDGEVVSVSSDKIDFQAIQKTLFRKDNVEVGSLHYYVFDACHEDEWFKCEQQYVDRFDFAVEAVADINNCLVHTVPVFRNVSFSPNNDSDAKQLISELENECADIVELGFEGLILRSYGSTVSRKRSKKLLKLKLFKDAEAIIVGSVEGVGKCANMLGALVCRFEDFEGIPSHTTFEIGTGFDDAERKYLWENIESIIGSKVNFKYFRLSDDGIPILTGYRSIRHNSDI